MDEVEDTLLSLHGDGVDTYLHSKALHLDVRQEETLNFAQLLTAIVHELDQTLPHVPHLQHLPPIPLAGKAELGDTSFSLTPM